MVARRSIIDASFGRFTRKNRSSRDWLTSFSCSTDGYCTAVRLSEAEVGSAPLASTVVDTVTIGCLVHCPCCSCTSVNVFEFSRQRVATRLEQARTSGIELRNVLRAAQRAHRAQQRLLQQQQQQQSTSMQTDTTNAVQPQSQPQSQQPSSSTTTTTTPLTSASSTATATTPTPATTTDTTAKKRRVVLTDVK